jgi:hypothetical protein
VFGEPVWLAWRHPEMVERPRRSFVLRLLIFAVGLVIGAASFGAIVGALGGVVLEPLDETVVAVVAGVVGAAVLARETVARRVPVPQIPWQVPRRWLAHFWIGAAAFGSIMGAGVFTRQPSALFHLYVLACFVSAEARSGALLGGIYACTYLVGFVYAVVSTREEAGRGNSGGLQQATGAAQWIGAVGAPLVFLVPFGVLGA